MWGRAGSSFKTSKRDASQEGKGAAEDALQNFLVSPLRQARLVGRFGAQRDSQDLFFGQFLRLAVEVVVGDRLSEGVFAKGLRKLELQEDMTRRAVAHADKIIGISRVHYLWAKV